MKPQCPKCLSFGHDTTVRFAPARPARSRRLLGLIPARAAVPEHLVCVCGECGYGWYRPTGTGEEG